MRILHNPNCLLSPTGKHIFNCGYDGVEVCKFCGERHEGLAVFPYQLEDMFLFRTEMVNKESCRRGAEALARRRKREALL